MTISLEEPEEDADGLEKVSVSLEEPEEAADGVEKVSVSLEEPEEAADGVEKVTVSLEEPEEAADGLEKVVVSLGEPEAVTGSPVRSAKCTATYADACKFFYAWLLLSCLRSEHSLKRYPQTWNLCF